MKTLLAFDIGNTNIDIGVFLDDNIEHEFRLNTDSQRTIDEYEALILPLLNARLGLNFKIDHGIVSSVVPPVTNIIVSLLKDRMNVIPKVVGPGIKTGIDIRIDDPKSLGSDRIVNAVAVKKLFGCPALVIDFGTATTIDFVSSAGNYEGGIIAPGPMIALDALVSKTSKLPKIELAWPTNVVGKGTIHAMQSGATIGYSCMVDGLINKIIEEVGPIHHIIATGGLGKVFFQHSTTIKSYDPFLNLRGLKIIFDLNI